MELLRGPSKRGLECKDPATVISGFKREDRLPQEGSANGAGCDEGG